MEVFSTVFLPETVKLKKPGDLNILRNTLSDLRARSTGVYHNTGEVKSAAVPKFRVDLHELKQKMNEIEEEFRLLANMQYYCSALDAFFILMEGNESGEGITTLLSRLAYEDFENWNQTISAVLGYIGVADIQLKAASNKLNPEKLQDMIENYEEVNKWLSENGYGAFADA